MGGASRYHAAAGREAIPERLALLPVLAGNTMHVEIANLTKTFGSLRANDAITLAFAAGQIHGVLGENGAGKSTLMKLLSGYIRRDTGEVRLNGQPVSLHNPAAALRAGVGMVHQDPLDVPAFSALENFFCASPRRVLPTRRIARQRLLETAERLGFSALPDAPVRSLTVGQRQQLEIMRLLACGVRVLILDEPTTGISAAQKNALFEALRRLVAAGETVLFVSHKLDEIADLCHTVSVLREGKLMGEGQMQMPRSQEHLLGLMFGQQSEPAPPPAPAPPVVPAEPAPDTDSDPVVPVWALENIAVREGALHLENLSLELPAGTIWGLSGLEGSGQQLLLRLLAGRIHPRAGRLRLLGRDMAGAPMADFRQAGVEYLPADRMNDGVIGPLSLTEHFILNRSNGTIINRQAARRAAQDAIIDYNIKAMPSTPLLALSGGNQQRAMLSLLPDPCTGLLFDQPTRGLDVVSARGVWQRLLKRRAAGTTTVFASADFDELLTYSDSLLVFFAGRISPPIPRNQLDTTRLAELIGGVGFETLAKG